MFESDLNIIKSPLLHTEQQFSPEERSGMFLRNVGMYLQVYTSLQHRRPTWHLHRREYFKFHTEFLIATCLNAAWLLSERLGTPVKRSQLST
jgi:hypothetical protein